MRYTAPYAAAPIIHINGWQGSGKRTIAAELAAQTGARLLHNHSLLAIPQALFDRTSPEFRELRQALRSITFEHALKLPPQTALILTDAFSDAPYETELFEQVVTFAQRRAALLVRVLLDIDPAENARRIADPARTAYGKLMDPDRLTELRNQHRLLHDANPDLRLDVTRLSPAEAAHALRQALHTVSGWGEDDQGKEF